MLLTLGLPVPVLATQHLSKRHTSGTVIPPNLVLFVVIVGETSSGTPCICRAALIRIAIALSHGSLHEGRRRVPSDEHAPTRCPLGVRKVHSWVSSRQRHRCHTAIHVWQTAKHPPPPRREQQRRGRAALAPRGHSAFLIAA